MDTSQSAHRYGSAVLTEIYIVPPKNRKNSSQEMFYVEVYSFPVRPISTKRTHAKRLPIHGDFMDVIWANMSKLIKTDVRPNWFDFFVKICFEFDRQYTS